MNVFKSVLVAGIAAAALTLTACQPAANNSASAAAAIDGKHDWTYGVRYVGGRKVAYGGGDIWVEQAMVTTFIPENPSHPPIVMAPGLGLGGTMYTTTTDGKRKGWAQVFAEAGYPVYVYDMPEYSTSGGFDPNMYDKVLGPLQANLANFGDPYYTGPCKDAPAAPAAAMGRAMAMAPAEAEGAAPAMGMGMAGVAPGGKVCPQPLPTEFNVPSWAIYHQVNNRAWIGIEDGKAWSGTKFPQDEYSITQAEKAYPYRWNDNRLEGTDVAPITGNVEAEGMVALYDEEIKEPYILMTHSAANGNIVPILDSRPEVIRAVIGFEPAFLYRGEPAEFAAKLKGKPYLSLYGDNVEARGHGNRRESNLVKLIPELEKLGSTAGAIDLPAMGITGNSHMLSQDTNNVEIAELLIEWLNENVD